MTLSGRKKEPSEEKNNKKPLTLQNLKNRSSIVQTNKPDIPVEYMHTYKFFLWLFYRGKTNKNPNSRLFRNKSRYTSAGEMKSVGWNSRKQTANSSMGSENLWAGYQKNCFSTLLRVLIIQFSKMVFPIWKNKAKPSWNLNRKNQKSVDTIRKRRKNQQVKRRDKTYVIRVKARYEEEEEEKKKEANPS